MKDRLIVGTANFGLEYGIANKKKISREEAFDILECVQTERLWGVDTATAYGDAEKSLGNFFEKKGKVFQVINKLPENDYTNAKNLEDDIFSSLKRMSFGYIDFLLFHSYDTYRRCGKMMIPVLRSLRRDGVIGHYGFSVYHPGDVENISKELKDPLAIEFPLNIFDHRFLKHSLMERLKSQGHFLFARSVFLQGLFFLDVKRLHGAFLKVRDKLSKIKTISEEYDIKPECLALLFAAKTSQADGVIVGVDSKRHLMGNIECFSDENLNKYRTLEPLLMDLSVDDEEIILPYKWNL